MEIKETIRGFDLIEFQDYYKTPCSLQKSSLAEEECVWFGRDIDQQVHPVFGDKLTTRMLLTRDQVQALIPYLQKFVATGVIV